MRRTRLLHFARPFSLVPFASALLACSAQVDSDYPGMTRPGFGFTRWRWR